jgi:hypothetical protein
VELVKVFWSVPNVIVVTESRTTPTARPPVRLSAPTHELVDSTIITYSTIHYLC